MARVGAVWVVLGVIVAAAIIAFSIYSIVEFSKTPSPEEQRKKWNPVFPGFGVAVCPQQAREISDLSLATASLGNA